MSADRLPAGTQDSTRLDDDRAGAPVDGVDAAASSTVQLRSRVRSWPVIIGTSAAIIALIWLVGVRPDSGLRPVQDGRTFSSAELRRGQHVLRSAGIEAVRTADRQLHVPPESLALADQTLSRAAAEPSDRTRQWKAASSLLDQFATGKRRDLAESAARAAQVARLLEQQPCISSAEIVWDAEPRIGRRRAPRVHATVFLNPSPNCRIGIDTVHAVRLAVAGSRAHLQPSDVVVMDLQRQMTFGAPQDPQAFARQARQAELTGRYRAQIESALAQLPGSRVFVQVREAQLSEAEEPGLSQSQFAQAAGRGPPSPPATAPIVSRSGPNLQLALPPKPVRPAMFRDRHASNVVAEINQPVAHVDVVVEIPPSVVTAQLGRDIPRRNPEFDPAPINEAAQRRIQSDIRRRVASAVDHSLPAQTQVNLTVRFDKPPAAQAPPGPPHSVIASFATWWTSLTAADTWPLPTVVLTILGAALVIGRRIFRRRQPSLDKLSQKRSGDTSPALSAVDDSTTTSLHMPRREKVKSPDAFLPGVEAAAWAPIAAREPPDVIAGLLKVLPSDEVARLIEQLSADQQREVLALTPTAALGEQDVEAVRGRLRRQVPAKTPPAAEIRVPQGRRRAGRDDKQHFAAKPTSGIDSLLDVDDESLRRLYRRIPPDTWSAALVAAPPGLRRRLSAINGEGDRHRLRQVSRPLRLREIESAQSLVLDEWEAVERERQVAG